jgi:DMSO/TMAO reductase YedYZ heme-binding membrane subunit
LSHYRTLPVALGAVAADLLVLLTLTAAGAGRFLGARWRAVHGVAVPTFVLVWLHGVLSGTDAAALRPIYALTGLTVSVLAVSRAWLRAPDSDFRGTGIDGR